MSSGIAIADKCVEAFNAMSKRSYSTVILKVNETMTEVNVEKTLAPTHGDPEAEWKDFLKVIPQDDCRFVLTDFSWKETPTVTKSKIIMILWSPEGSPVRSKMIYASSQEAVTTKMQVQRSVQATELDEISYDQIKKDVCK